MEIFLFDALGQSLGGQDIDFEDDKAFSDAFVLQGDNETAVRDLFDTQVRQWFVAQAARSFFFETRGDTLLFHTGNRRPPREANDCPRNSRRGKLFTVRPLVGNRHD